MRYYWQDGLPEERDALIEKYRSGVKAPRAWWDMHGARQRRPYRSFKQSEREEEDGRSAFFRSLDAAVSAAPLQPVESADR